MVEILLSLIFLVALASWPRLGIQDRTIDGLFLTFTGACHVPAIPVQLHLPTAL
jgi:hypothetical protein